jgi:hypothetical protein
MLGDTRLCSQTPREAAYITHHLPVETPPLEARIAEGTQRRATVLAAANMVRSSPRQDLFCGSRWCCLVRWRFVVRQTPFYYARKSTC